MRNLQVAGAQLAIEYLPTVSLSPNPKNPRHHTEAQVSRLAAIIRGVWWTSPVLVDEHGMVLAGHARLLAAIKLDLAEVPCIRLRGLTHAQKLAITVGDNKMTDESSWDPSLLRSMLLEITRLEFDVELTGFTTGEVDFTINGSPAPMQQDVAESVPPIQMDQPAITYPGDVWRLGRHKLMSGSALDVRAYETLLGGDRAQAVFSAPL